MSLPARSRRRATKRSTSRDAVIVTQEGTLSGKRALIGSNLSGAPGWPRRWPVPFWFREKETTPSSTVHATAVWIEAEQKKQKLVPKSGRVSADKAKRIAELEQAQAAAMFHLNLDPVGTPAHLLGWKRSPYKVLGHGLHGGKLTGKTFPTWADFRVSATMAAPRFHPMKLRGRGGWRTSAYFAARDAWERCVDSTNSFDAPECKQLWRVVDRSARGSTARPVLLENPEIAPRSFASRWLAAWRGPIENPSSDREILGHVARIEYRRPGLKNVQHFHDFKRRPFASYDRRAKTLTIAPVEARRVS